MDNTRLLVIDDDKDLVNMINRYFNHTKEVEVVLEAHDGEEAINIINQHSN